MRLFFYEGNVRGDAANASSVDCPEVWGVLGAMRVEFWKAGQQVTGTVAVAVAVAVAVSRHRRLDVTICNVAVMARKARSYQLHGSTAGLSR